MNYVAKHWSVTHSVTLSSVLYTKIFAGEDILFQSQYLLTCVPKKFVHMSNLSMIRFIEHLKSLTDHWKILKY